MGIHATLEKHAIDFICWAAHEPVGQNLADRDWVRHSIISYFGHDYPAVEELAGLVIQNHGGA